MPQTIEEWNVYISQLAGESLRSKGINANTQMFADALMEEGYELADVERIVLAFVRQFVATGQKIPEGGAWDMVEMAATDSICQQGTLLSEEQVDRLAASPPMEGMDTVDQALQSAADED